MTDRELLTQALEALSAMLTHMGMDEDDWNKPTFNQCRKAEAALRERLAQPEFDSDLQSAAMTQTAPKLAQPEQKRPQMRRATREEKIDRPGVYWVPVEPEPVAYQFQDRDGKWYPFINEQHYRNTVEDGRWPIRALYTAPQPNTIANSEAIPEQISEQEPLNLNCKSVQARLAAQWGYVKAEQEQKRPQNCGTSYCSCIECVMEPAQPVQEPVGVIYDHNGGANTGSLPPIPIVVWVNRIPDIGTKLYATPPRREWVGLTDEERDAIWDDYNLNGDDVTRAIEAKLKEKNQCR